MLMREMSPPFAPDADELMFTLVFVATFIPLTTHKTYMSPER